jgi:hypothetical protein
LRAGAIGFGQHRQVSAKLALRSSRKGAAAWVLLLKCRQRLVDGGGRIGIGTVSAGAGLGVIGVSVRTSLPADRAGIVPWVHAALGPALVPVETERKKSLARFSLVRRIGEPLRLQAQRRSAGSPRCGEKPRLRPSSVPDEDSIAAASSKYSK